jgi:4Fe-4S ferredoxin
MTEIAEKAGRAESSDTAEEPGIAEMPEKSVKPEIGEMPELEEKPDEAARPATAEKQEIEEKGENVRSFGELEQYPRLVAEAVTNERCLPCLLCEPVCPTRAIKVTFTGTREDFGPLRKGIAGKISIDREKCNLCGLCAKFCKAFLLIEKGEKEKSPRDLVPYEQLLVDEDLCDYCGLCVPLCPEEAITVEGEPLEGEPKPNLVGKIEIDKDQCIGCGRCVLVCPYDAVEAKKPFEGEIGLIEKRMEKCDPLGCQACFNVCPAKCWYVDERGKAAPVKEQCILCGACAKVCPVEAIEVKRSQVSHTPVKETPWATEWKDALASLVTGEKRRPDTSKAVVPPLLERPPLAKVEMPRIDLELLKLVEEALRPLGPALKKPRIRKILEKEKSEKAGSEIMERLAKKEAEEAGEERSGEEKAAVEKAGESKAELGTGSRKKAGAGAAVEEAEE